MSCKHKPNPFQCLLQEPKDIAVVMQCDDTQLWWENTMAEWKEWEELKVFEWVDPPNEVNIINSKVV